MNSNGKICIDIARTERTTELLMNAVLRYTSDLMCLKCIAHRFEQVNKMKMRYDYVNVSLAFEHSIY